MHVYVDVGVSWSVMTTKVGYELFLDPNKKNI